MSQVSVVIDLPNAEATQHLGYRLGQYCSAGTVFLLSGNLGSGKTTLVQGVGVGLGISEPISSPTFTFVNEYLEGRIPLYHMDLYRLNPLQVNSLELESYWEGVETIPGVVAIEWAERIMERPKLAIEVLLEDNFEGGRQATLMAMADAHLVLLRMVIGDGLLAYEV